MKLNGEIFLEQFNKYKMKGTAVLVSGNEFGLIAKIEGLIIKELTNNSINKEVVFDFKTNKKNNFIDLINSKSLFGNHNVIKIINPIDSLVKSLENINIDNNTIIINGDNVKNNSKIKRFFDSHNKFYSIVCYKLTDKYKIKLIDKFISKQKSKSIEITSTLPGNTESRPTRGISPGQKCAPSADEGLLGTAGGICRVGFFV